MSSTGGAIGISAASAELEKSTIDGIDNLSSSKDPSIREENGEVIEVNSVDQHNVMLSHLEQFPEDPDGEIEEQQFTVRAVLVGCLLGGVIAASKYVPPSILPLVC